MRAIYSEDGVIIDTEAAAEEWEKDRRETVNAIPGAVVVGLLVILAIDLT